MEGIIWLVILAVMLVIELVTLGLTTIWFTIGALGAAIASWLGFGVMVQIVVFIILSLVSMVLCRPFAVRFLNKGRVRTNVEDVIGKVVLVRKEINNEQAQGEVLLNGLEWTARSEDGCVIPEGERVTVVSVEGVKLIVKQMVLS